MIDKIKNFFFWATHTKLGWLLISIAWFITFMMIDGNIDSNWAFWVAMPAAAYILGLFLVMMAYAWVINPIRDWKENKKMKQ